MSVMRTDYWNESTGTVRGGATGHNESFTDVERFFLPLGRLREKGLHSWGVVEGLRVSAVSGQAGLTVEPGTVLDGEGRLAALTAGGFAVDPAVALDEVTDLPTVTVPASGLVVPTGTTPGEFVLTLAWAEVPGEGEFTNVPTRLHAPRLRLRPAAGFVGDGEQLLLARVTLAAGGAVTALSSLDRRVVGVRAGRLELTAPESEPGGGLGVRQSPVAELHGTAGGGAELGVRTATGFRAALTVDAAGTIDLASDGTLRLLGREALRGDDAWLRLNQAADFPAGVHTPSLLGTASLNVGGLNDWGDPGPGNIWASGRATVVGGIETAGSIETQGALSIGGRDALRSGGTWLVLNPALQFTAGVYAPAVLAAPGVNIGGLNSWGNPGHGNLWATGRATVAGGIEIQSTLSIFGKEALRGNDGWLRLNQTGQFPSGVHANSVFAPLSLNVGGLNNWGNPGNGNAWISGLLHVEGDVRLGAANRIVYIGGNKSGRFMALNDDLWFADPQDGVIELWNSASPPGWGSLRGKWLNPSSRTYKRDVDQLERSEVDGLLADARRTEVVWYHWLTDPDDGPRHLGVIAEQVPDYLLADDGKSLLMPECFAMLLGALQALERDVTDLRAAGSRPTAAHAS